MKVIFLDVDGVLTHRLTVGRGRENTRVHRFLSQLDADCVERLMEIVSRTGAKIVVSSTWRLHPHSMGALHAMARRARKRRLIYDKTGVCDIKRAGFHVPARGIEISQWIEQHESVRGPLESYVVIDDGHVEGHPMVLVKNGFDCGGLRDHHVQEAINILGEKT